MLAFMEKHYPEDHGDKYVNSVSDGIVTTGDLPNDSLPQDS